MSVLLEADYTYPHCLCLIVTKETGYDFLIEAEYPIREYHVVFQKWLRVSCHRVNTKSSFVGFLKLLVPGNCFCSFLGGYIFHFRSISCSQGNSLPQAFNDSTGSYMPNA